MDDRMDGRTDGRMNGRTDRRTDVWKLCPVSYRTSALWSRCPKRANDCEKDKQEKQ